MPLLPPQGQEGGGNLPSGSSQAQDRGRESQRGDPETEPPKGHGLSLGALGQWDWAVRLLGEVSFQAPGKRGGGLGRGDIAGMDRGAGVQVQMLGEDQQELSRGGGEVGGSCPRMRESEAHGSTLSSSARWGWAPRMGKGGKHLCHLGLVCGESLSWQGRYLWHQFIRPLQVAAPTWPRD